MIIPGMAQGRGVLKENYKGERRMDNLISIPSRQLEVHLVEVWLDPVEFG